MTSLVKRKPWNRYPAVPRGSPFHGAARQPLLGAVLCVAGHCTEMGGGGRLAGAGIGDLVTLPGTQLGLRGGSAGMTRTWGR